MCIRDRSKGVTKSPPRAAGTRRRKQQQPEQQQQLPRESPISDVSILAKPDAVACPRCSEPPLPMGLYHSISEHHPQCFDALLHEVTEGGTKLAPLEVNTATRWGKPALCYACSYNRMRCVKALLAAGASVHGNSNSYPLSWSCGHAGVAKYLLRCGARASEPCQSCRPASTVLMRAQEERGRGKAYDVWADVIESAAGINLVPLSPGVRNAT
eukprot:TRINITY_DN50374_c0_g1_i1.p1 TRINITY_DN50374_c0_g1~~TRINITY_DN50374_c0_g1_i1.p1  ORF type:complete len:241 (+),score=34.08 TRINITY_DN50374_c0_g1_i1:85-723(+)